MDKEIVIEVAERYQLRPYKPSQLCDLYEISKKTFLKWIKPFEKEIGERAGHFYTIHQVQKIFEKLGIPGKTAADRA